MQHGHVQDHGQGLIGNIRTPFERTLPDTTGQGPFALYEECPQVTLIAPHAMGELGIASRLPLPAYVQGLVITPA